MKRSVAVLGHTPQFIRWAIEHPCSLRSVSRANLPDQSFRQLRSLREYSVGLSEGRVIDGVCLHRTATSSQSDEARGFFGSEVLEAHGDESFVQNCCVSCPANAIQDRQAGVWAGCYGWLPATPDFQFDVTDEAIEARPVPDDSQPEQLVADLDEVITELDMEVAADRLFKPTSPRWYGIWRTEKFAGETLSFLLRAFTQVALRSESPSADLAHFLAALKRCVKHKLTLHASLVPPGYSDGRTWQLSGYCPDCGLEMKSTGQQKCSSCGRYGHPHEIRKSKVLGLRPYVFLSGVIGESATAQLLQKFESTDPTESD